jgi:hypothetical protein
MGVARLLRDSETAITDIKVAVATVFSWAQAPRILYPDAAAMAAADCTELDERASLGREPKNRLTVCAMIYR